MWILIAMAWAGSGVRAEAVTHRGETFQVVHVDLAHANLRLVGQEDGQDGTLETALKSHAGARMATNAGMYDSKRAPVGLHVEGGREVHPVVRNATYGNFGLLPNGVFAVDASGARVVPTPEWKGPTTWATQSGPMLVIDGAIHPKLNPEGTSRKTRSGVGVVDSGHVVFALSDGPVRFHDFATLFCDVLGCDDALFLDGTVSSLWVDGTVHGMAAGQYSGVWVAALASPRGVLEWSPIPAILAIWAPVTC